MCKKILIVDDHAHVRRLLEILISRAGYEVILTDDGEKAVPIALEQHPDLILMDVMMPMMSGFEAARRIRADIKGARIPIMFLTAKDEIADKRQGFEIGAEDYIVKPFDNDDLIARIQRRLDRIEEIKKDEVKARSETISQLMVTIAHYLNNSLAVIQGRAQMTNPENPESVKAMLSTLELQTAKISIVVRSLEEMAREQEIKPADYAGMKNTMFDLSQKLEKRLNKLKEQSADKSFHNPLGE